MARPAVASAKADSNPLAPTKTRFFLRPACERSCSDTAAPVSQGRRPSHLRLNHEAQRGFFSRDETAAVTVSISLAGCSPGVRHLSLSGGLKARIASALTALRPRVRNLPPPDTPARRSPSLAAMEPAGRLHPPTGPAIGEVGLL